MWQMSTHANAMLFCYEISLLKFYALLSWNLYCSDLGTLCVKKKISKNCISGEKITNMRSAPFLQCQYFNWNCYSNPSFTDTKRFFTATDTDTKILICLSFKHRHQLISSSAHCQHQHQGQLSSYAHLCLISISICISSSISISISSSAILLRNAFRAKNGIRWEKFPNSKAANHGLC